MNEGIRLTESEYRLSKFSNFGMGPFHFCREKQKFSVSTWVSLWAMATFLTPSLRWGVYNCGSWGHTERGEEERDTHTDITRVLSTFFSSIIWFDFVYSLFPVGIDRDNNIKCIHGSGFLLLPTSPKCIKKILKWERVSPRAESFQFWTMLSLFSYTWAGLANHLTWHATASYYLATGNCYMALVRQLGLILSVDTSSLHRYMSKWTSIKKKGRKSLYCFDYWLLFCMRWSGNECGNHPWGITLVSLRSADLWTLVSGTISPPSESVCKRQTTPL